MLKANETITESSVSVVVYNYFTNPDAENMLVFGGVPEDVLKQHSSDTEHGLAKEPDGQWKVPLQYTMVNNIRMQGSVSKYVIPDPSQPSLVMP